MTHGIPSVNPQCEAPTKRGHCKRPAGWGTDHRGSGFCINHDRLEDHDSQADEDNGRRFLFDSPVLKELARRHAAVDDPFDLTGDITIARAAREQYLNLLAENIDDFKRWADMTGNRPPKSLLDPVHIKAHSDSITSMVNAHTRARQSKALTRADTELIFAEWGETVLGVLEEVIPGYLGLPTETFDEMLDVISQKIEQGLQTESQ